MKLVRYSLDGERIKPGIICKNKTVRDLSSHLVDVAPPSLSLNVLERIRDLDIESLPQVDPKATLEACVGGVGKFICIGLNYLDHVEETGAALPSEPIFFSKYTSALCGPNSNIVIPIGSNKLDWEVELGVIIGKKGKRISEQYAEDHIAGFCVVNDISERDYQLNHPGGQWVRGKSCDTFGPIGPYLVTKDEIKNFDNLHLWLEVDGVRYQDSNTSMMIHKIPYLISYLSNFFTLEEGDVISTGTPAGVGLGQKPNPIYLKKNQIMRLGIEGLGDQTQLVVKEE